MLKGFRRWLAFFVIAKTFGKKKTGVWKKLHVFSKFKPAPTGSISDPNAIFVDVHWLRSSCKVHWEGQGDVPARSEAVGDFSNEALQSIWTKSQEFVQQKVTRPQAKWFQLKEFSGFPAPMHAQKKASWRQWSYIFGKSTKASNSLLIHGYFVSRPARHGDHWYVSKGPKGQSTKSTTVLSAVRQRFQDVLDISADLAMVPPWASWHPRKPARVDFPTKPVVLTFLSNAPETQGGQGIKCVNTVIYIYIYTHLVGGWTTHLKNMLVKLDHLPRDRGEN